MRPPTPPVTPTSSSSTSRTDPLATIDVTTSATASSIAAIGQIAAGSGFNKTGAGVLTIDTPLAFNGGINVAEGTLVLTNGGTLGGGTVSFDAGTTFRLSKNDGIVTNQVGGNGALLVDVAGATLAGNASFDTVTIAPNASLTASASLAAATSTTVLIGGSIDGTGATAFTLGEATLGGEVTNAPATTTTTRLFAAAASSASFAVASVEASLTMIIS